MEAQRGLHTHTHERANLSRLSLSLSRSYFSVGRREWLQSLAGRRRELVLLFVAPFFSSPHHLDIASRESARLYSLARYMS